MLLARSDAFGTMIVSQSRVSTTVWRQRISRTLPCLPFSSCSQSPTWIDPSSCSATPPITLPSVVWSDSARTPETIALVAMTLDRFIPDAWSTPIVVAM